MKLIVQWATTAMALGCLTLTVQAGKQTPGPKGGRLLENEAPRAEFFVEKDGKVTVIFYDKDLRPVAPGGQVVAVIAEAKSGKQKLEFEKKGDALVSTKPLPEGEGYNVVVKIKATPDAKTENFRIKYETTPCGKCKRPEYACICDE